MSTTSGTQTSARFLHNALGAPFDPDEQARDRALKPDERVTAILGGKENGVDAARFPFRVDARVMARGRERFDIYCSPCHGRTGMGDGMVVRRGYRHPPAFDIDRLREAPVGHFFDVMTNGFGAMPDYAAQVKASDRWAIAAYIRALPRLSATQSAAEVEFQANQERTLAEHKVIFTALSTHDAVGARAAMRRHLKSVEMVLAKSNLSELKAKPK